MRWWRSSIFISVVSSHPGAVEESDRVGSFEEAAAGLSARPLRRGLRSCLRGSTATDRSSPPRDSARVVFKKLVFGRSASFNSSEFVQDAWLDLVTFVRETHFEAAEFSQISSFDTTTVSQRASFKAATFKKNSYFVSTVFSHEASFECATFVQEAFFDSAIFKQKAVFNSATFMQRAWLDSIKFVKGALFKEVKFLEYVSFDATTFEGRAEFVSANFLKYAWFICSTFKLKADFSSATFEGFSYFRRTRFGSEGDGICLPVFTESQFAKPTSFREAVFRDRYPIFAGAVLHDKTSFTAEDANWPTDKEKLSSEEIEVARESCAVIRHALAKQGLPEDEHFFFRREMQFARQIGSFWQQLPYHLFGIFSEYGYSIKRPLWWLLGLWALGVAAFCGYFSRCCVPAPERVVEHPIASGMALSFSNLFPVFGFGRGFGLNETLQQLPPVLQLFSGFQTVAALPLLFFLGLALRQRFRLR